MLSIMVRFVLKFLDLDEMSKKELTDLEAMIIGCVAKSPGRTRYSVKKVFQRSLSSHWSGSAGAIYPAVDRLVSRGLLRETLSGTSGRPSKSLFATSKGKRQFADWMNDTSVSALTPIDPLRVRINFLGLSDGNDEITWLKSVEDSLKENLVAVKGAMEGQLNDKYSDMISRGFIATAEAQLRWLRSEKSRLLAKDRQSDD
jgi:DNA-binding PadR family transcriptional regulator